MRIHEIVEKYDAEIATVVNHNDWVRARAREIDLDNELHLAEHLNEIMVYARELYRFAGVSSNNIYWNLTHIPIRTMYIPTENGFVTIINPKILKSEGKAFNSVEGCGSIPDNVYTVKRKPHISFSGYTLEKKYIELECGSKDYEAGEDPVLSSYNAKACVVQHEMDHLDGVTIKDKGTLFDLSSLME